MKGYLKIAAATLVSLTGLATAAEATSVIYGVNAYKFDVTTQQTVGGGIYSLDIATGAVNFVAPTVASFPAGSPDYAPNSLAYNNNTNTFVYSGCCSFNPGDTAFSIKGDGTGAKNLGTLAGSSASGSFYNNAYYYMIQGATDLKKVTFNADGSVATQESLSLNLSDGKSYTFGDIAINDQGLLVGSGRSSITGQMELFNVNLAANNLTVGVYGNTELVYQLAFIENALYGTSASTNEIYKFDTATNQMTGTGVKYAPNFIFNDLANGKTYNNEVPEPGTLGLLGLGLVAASRRKKRKMDTL